MRALIVVPVAAAALATAVALRVVASVADGGATMLGALALNATGPRR